jgi:hypothetical protein
VEQSAGKELQLTVIVKTEKQTIHTFNYNFIIVCGEVCIRTPDIAVRIQNETSSGILDKRLQPSS